MDSEVDLSPTATVDGVPEDSALPASSDGQVAPGRSLPESNDAIGSTSRPGRLMATDDDTLLFPDGGSLLDSSKEIEVGAEILNSPSGGPSDAFPVSPRDGADLARTTNAREFASRPGGPTKTADASAISGADGGSEVAPPSRPGGPTKTPCLSYREETRIATPASSSQARISFHRAPGITSSSPGVDRGSKVGPPLQPQQSLPDLMTGTAPSQAPSSAPRVSSLAVITAGNEARRVKRQKALENTFHIRNLTQPLVEDVLDRMTQQNLYMAMHASFFMVRSALSPCLCTRPRGRLVAALVESKRGSLRAVVPSEPRWLQPAGRMISRFLNMSFETHAWLKIVDCRGGIIAMVRDRMATQVLILRLFVRLSITSLPVAPHTPGHELVAGGIIPMAGLRFNIFLILRSNRCQQLCFKIFSSQAGQWQQMLVTSPFLLSPTPTIRTVGVYSSGQYYVLDPGNKKVLIVDINSYVSDAIALPTEGIQEPVSLLNNILARSSTGRLYWVVLDGYFVQFFILTGSAWTVRWRRRIPDHLVPEELSSHADDSGIVLFRSGQSFFGMDIEDGNLIHFTGTAAGRVRVFSLEIGHTRADHVFN